MGFWPNKESKVEIIGNELGNFQVWKGNEVLHPRNLRWEPAFMADLDSFWVGSLEAAEKALANVMAKNDKKLVKVYEIKE
jgi:hypothetical protein